MWTRPELSYIVNGSIKCLITLGNNLAVSSIVKHTLTHDPEISLQGNANTCLHIVFTTALLIIATNWKQYTHVSRSGIFIQQAIIQQLQKHTNIYNKDESPGLPRWHKW